VWVAHAARSTQHPVRIASAAPDMKSVLRIIAVNAVLLVAGAAALELVFGDWFGEPSVRQLGLQRDVDRRNDACGLYGGPECIVRYSRDHYGLRGDFGDPAAIDILTVGGSTTDQRYIDDARTWDAVLQDELRRSGRDVTVANAGVDGQSSYGHLKDFDLWFPRVPGLAPRYYLFYIGVNDLLLTGESGYDSMGPGEGWREMLRARSAIYDALRKLHGMYLARQVYGVAHSRIDFAAMRWVDRPLVSDYDDLMKAGLAAYRERVAALARRARSRGGVPVFVTQATHEYRRIGSRLQGTSRIVKFRGTETNGVDRYHMLMRLNRVTMEACAAEGGVCLDLANELDFEDADFYDYFHNTPRGAAKIGRYLARKLGVAM
jgi:hypothetical protein